jgi:hypothetical protein
MHNVIFIRPCCERWRQVACILCERYPDRTMLLLADMLVENKSWAASAIPKLPQS